MKNELQQFVDTARGKGWTDDRIQSELTQAGWAPDSISTALNDLVVPRPPAQDSTNTVSPDLSAASQGPRPSVAAPVSVVSNLTTRGFEYKIFSVSLTLLIFSVIFLANVMIGADASSTVAAFPLTVMIVAGPIALYMFRRLRAAELANPRLHADASRRQVVQGIQLITFLAVVIHTVVLLYLVISGHYAPNDSVYATSQPNVFADALRWLVTVIIAGGTFAYYWRDDHRRD